MSGVSGVVTFIQLVLADSLVEYLAILLLKAVHLQDTVVSIYSLQRSRESSQISKLLDKKQPSAAARKHCYG